MSVSSRLPFKQGLKQVFLPNAIFTMVRGSGKLPPNQVQFLVPLNVNKFDIRDYLYNLYKVTTTNVKVMIQLSPIQRGSNYERRKNLHMKLRLPFQRPSSVKKCIVTLEEPFVYPPALSKEEAKTTFDLATTEIMKERQVKGRNGVSRGKLSRFMVKGRHQ